MMKFSCPGKRPQQPSVHKPFARTLVVMFALAISACSTNSFTPQNVSSSAFLERAVTQSSDNVTVRAALPDAAETEALVGIDLYDQGIQPIWLEVTNNSARPVRASLWSIDRDYFSPIEVAYMNKGRYSSQGYADLERWLKDNGMARYIAPGGTRSGLVFTHLKPGTKGFNLDLISRDGLESFTFFLALPGFVPDYMGVDFAALYDDNDIKAFDQAAFIDYLSNDLSCCATDSSGEQVGAPLNMVLVGSPKALRRSFMRGNWVETSLDVKEKIAEKQHRFESRPPDGRFYLDRADGEERVLLNIWLAPWRVGKNPTWVAQAYYRHNDLPIIEFLRENEQFQDSELLAKFVGESISADIDSAQRFIVQNLWYNQSVRRVGFVPGVAPKSIEDPGHTFDGYGYFTAGGRAVLQLSETPVSMSETEFMPFVGPAAGERSE